MDAREILNAYYGAYDEEGRLLSRHGQVEYRTTMRYIQRFLRPGARVLEIGAGTGRYSLAIAEMGYPVDAVELVGHNIEQFRAKIRPGLEVSVRQGNAMDLSFLPDESYDLVLLLGPMYHLFTGEDQRRAYSEAVRVTKKGGVLMTAFCMMDPTILQYGFVKGNVPDLIAKGLLDTEEFRARSTPAELFQLWRTEDIARLVGAFPVERLRLVGTDMATNYLREAVDSMDDEMFELYLRYHFSICERADLIGASHHTLDIARRLC